MMSEDNHKRREGEIDNLRAKLRDQMENDPDLQRLIKAKVVTVGHLIIAQQIPIKANGMRHTNVWIEDPAYYRNPAFVEEMGSRIVTHAAETFGQEIDRVVALTFSGAGEIQGISRSEYSGLVLAHEVARQLNIQRSEDSALRPVRVAFAEYKRMGNNWYSIERSLSPAEPEDPKVLVVMGTIYDWMPDALNALKKSGINVAGVAAVVNTTSITANSLQVPSLFCICNVRPVFFNADVGKNKDHNCDLCRERIRFNGGVGYIGFGREGRAWDY